MPAPQITTAEATQTFIPVVGTEASATPVPSPTAQPSPSPTPLPTPSPTATTNPGGPIAAISLEPVVTEGLSRPLYVTHAGDGRLFVVGQSGTIKIIEDGRLLDRPFLDVTDRVGAFGNEQGLLSVAFHPDYLVEGSNGYGKFYVNYTDVAGGTKISRFTADPADPNVADAQSEVVLLSFDQPFPNHNGGLMIFGPDGYLYVGSGDGGSANDPLNSGQSLDTYLGKLLRIDVSDGGETYVVPPSNPFIDQPDAKPEIWAWGLRNPWRFSFDAQTGDLFIADVGQGTWEEVNFQAAESSGGENYGWNIMEGSHCFESESCDSDGLVLPVAEYSHDEGGCSVTGGYVYRGQAHPELNGNYFYGDYCTGIIWRLYPDGDDWEPVVVSNSGLNITSFGEDLNGELYVVDRSGGIYHIVP